MTPFILSTDYHMSVIECSNDVLYLEIDCFELIRLRIYFNLLIQLKYLNLNGKMHVSI